jgi:hypothetical protein
MLRNPQALQRPHFLDDLINGFGAHGAPENLPDAAEFAVEGTAATDLYATGEIERHFISDGGPSVAAATATNQAMFQPGIRAGSVDRNGRRPDTAARSFRPHR